MVNIITMAGKGKRFLDEGFILPKPLIEVQGKPMIHRVIESLPESDKWIFVVRQEHIDNYSIDKVIKEKIPNAIITVDKDLLGGVSIFCAKEYLEDDEEVLIAGCDFAFLINNNKFENLKKDADCIVWTFTKEQRIVESPNSWGYVVLNSDGKIINSVSVKKPISEDPYNDHVIAATFWIKSVKLLYEGIEKIIKEDIRTNGEYYLDSLPIVYNLLGKKSLFFDVDLIISWGTPKEYHQFGELYHYYKYCPKKIKRLPDWRKYFENVFNK